MDIGGGFVFLLKYLANINDAEYEKYQYNNNYDTFMEAVMGFDSRPTVFVSSTCYDLKQIRNDLKHFVEDELGYAALLSESDSFPVDPTISIFENCVRNVDERADLFVLIIGGRYGFVTDSGQSVTNIEYLHARQKNIPIYVYIDKSILSNIPLWKENPNGSFKSIVDTAPLIAATVPTFINTGV